MNTQFLLKKYLKQEPRVFRQLVKLMLEQDACEGQKTECAVENLVLSRETKSGKWRLETAYDFHKRTGINPYG